MKRNPLYVFRDEQSRGIIDVPLNSVIQILSVGGDPNHPRVLMVELISKEGLNSTSTIMDLLNNSDLYNILSDGTPGGELTKFQDINNISDIGYKLQDSDLNNYGPVGLKSVDFSFQEDGTILGGANGLFSFASGESNIASGDNSTVFGKLNEASGLISVSFGYKNKTSGRYSAAFGNLNEVTGESAFASGHNNLASGLNSATFGTTSTASGANSITCGSFLLTSGDFSFSTGVQNESSGLGSFTSGNQNKAIGEYSNAINFLNTASGNYSHAEGNSTNASGLSSHSEGYKTIASGDYSHSCGYRTTAIGKASYAEGLTNSSEGDYSHTEGWGNLAIGISSHASGYYTTAAGVNSYAGGHRTEATGNNSFAIGTNTIADAQNSGAFGFSSKVNASGNNSYAFGTNTEVSSINSVAFGAGTYIGGISSFAFGQQSSINNNANYSISGGFKTRVNSSYSAGFGQEIIINNDNSLYFGRFNNPKIGDILEIGIGQDSNNRKNAFEITDTGLVKAPELVNVDLSTASNDTIITKNHLINIADEISHDLVSQLEAIEENSKKGWRLIDYTTNGTYGDIGTGSIDFMVTSGNNIDKEGAIGDYSVTFGEDNLSSGLHSFTSGFLNEAIGDNSVSLGLNNKSSGANSITSGEENETSGGNSFSTGNLNINSGMNSILCGENNESQNNNTAIFGYSNKISGNNSFAAGSSNTITGISSHSLGSSNINTSDNNILLGYNNTINSGLGITLGFDNIINNSGSLLLGRGLISNTNNLMAVGRYNLGDSGNIFEIGSGSSTTIRKNAIEITTDGLIIAPETTLAKLNSAPDNVLVTKEFFTNTIGYLEKITEGNPGSERTGYRLRYRDPNSVGDIGTEAIDLCFSDEVGNLSFGATGDYSVALGFKTEASNLHSMSVNYSTHATGSDSFAEGHCSTAAGYASHSEGMETRAINEAMHAAGKFNIGTSIDTIHETGIGIDDAHRANAFEIYTNGLILAPEETETIINNGPIKTLVTKEWVQNNAGGDYSTGLEKITEGSNTGWRLIDQDPNNYGNIGNDAVDLSINTTVSNVSGATGNIAFAEGYNVRAEGNYSHAEGYRTISQNDNMHSEGKYNLGTATDTIHETGIGTDDTHRANAFEIYTNGLVTAPEETSTLIDNGPAKTLVTKEWVSDKLQQTTQTFNTYNITAADGQQSIIIDDIVFNLAGIHTNGILINPTEYIISNDGTDTTITFNTPLIINDWVNIVPHLFVSPHGVDDTILTNDQNYITLNNILFIEARIHINGILINPSKYIISDNGTDTTVTFDYTLYTNDWINTQY